MKFYFLIDADNEEGNRIEEVVLLDHSLLAVEALQLNCQIKITRTILRIGRFNQFLIGTYSLGKSLL